MSKEYTDTKMTKREMTEDNDGSLLDIGRLVDDAFKGLMRYWVIFLVLLSVFSTVFYFHAKRVYVPKYYAATTFIVNTNTALNYSEAYYNKATTEQLAKTFPYIIMNDALRHLIEEDLGVDEIPGEIEASALENTNMITISVEAYSAEDAYDILQSVIKNYPEVARSVVGETQLNVIDETGMPIEPMNSAGARSSALKGFIVAGALCCVWLVLYALTRQTIRREDDFKKMLNVKCLSSVPLVKFKKRSDTEKNQLIIHNPRVSYGFTESNRTLRTRIEKDALEHGSKIYMVSSAMPQEGKSTISVNLALSLAAKGKKVILIDLDLRNPSVADTLGIPRKELGFVDLLRSSLQPKDIITRYQETSLYVIQGGKPVRNTANLLTKDKIEKICSKLRKMADYVIVDTSPSSLLADASNIVKYMDAGIYVVRQDFTPLDGILDGIEMLTDTGLRLVGCVLNCAEVGFAGYGYGYGYGRYGYGRYGSKYGSKYGNKYASKYMSSPVEEEKRNS